MRFLVMPTSNQNGGGVSVTVPGLPGLITEGESVEDALEQAREAIELSFEDETAESLAANRVWSDYILATVDVAIGA